MSAEALTWILLLVTIVLAVITIGLILRLQSRVASLPDELASQDETRHRDILAALAEQLAKQSQRLMDSLALNSDRVRSAVGDELGKTRAAVATLQNEQTAKLHENKEVLVRELLALSQLLTQKQDALKADMLSQTLEKIAEQSRLQTTQMQDTMRLLTLQINERIEGLTKTNDTKLAEISGKVAERLDEGFKKTNETFVNVMTRLATIDEAQKKLDGLTSNVVSLQQLLGDKKSRGAFGEMQLEQIIRNMLPEGAFEFQYSFTHGNEKVIADCVLKLPEPVGLIAVDSKFPLENYERMVSDDADKISSAMFKADVKKHVDAIASKYIIQGVTSEGAMMFVPAEAVFAEIHARHRDVVEHAQRQRVWIVSPTTLMAVLNTVRAVLKDVETRKQVHIIQNELGKLGKEFGRFDERMKKLAEHIRQANKDVDDVAITSKKISDRFQSIERVDLATELEVGLLNDNNAATQPNLVLIKSDVET